MYNILLTGSLGFIGSHVCIELILHPFRNPFENKFEKCAHIYAFIPIPI